MSNIPSCLLSRRSAGGGGVPVEMPVQRDIPHRFPLRDPGHNAQARGPVSRASPHTGSASGSLRGHHIKPRKQIFSNRPERQCLPMYILSVELVAGLAFWSLKEGGQGGENSCLRPTARGWNRQREDTGEFENIKHVCRINQLKLLL